jgi:nucleoside-triphosphatase THEP1
MSGICIYTGEIKSGKTTRLQKYISENPGSDGILAPVINGKKHLVRIKTNETKLLESDGADYKAELTKICSYNFLKSVFDWGQAQLLEAFRSEPEILIIDEIGPLELRGDALEPAISEILKKSPAYNSKIIIVVRNFLVDKVIEHYKLHKTGFKFLNI